MIGKVKRREAKKEGKKTYRNDGTLGLYGDHGGGLVEWECRGVVSGEARCNGSRWKLARAVCAREVMRDGEARVWGAAVELHPVLERKKDRFSRQGTTGSLYRNKARPGWRRQPCDFHSNSASSTVVYIRVHV